VLLPRRAVLAAAATRAATPTHTPRLRVRALALTSALRLGAAPHLGERLCLWAPYGADAGAMEDLLGDLVGAEITLSVRLGPARANRKPVVHALTAAGSVAAVAKLGVTDLTRSLVLTEADALRRIGRTSLRSVSTPRLLHAGAWGTSELVVQTPLVATRRQIVPEPARVEAMREVAAIGIARRALSTSRFVAGLQQRIRAVGRLDHRERLLAALARVVAGHEAAGGLIDLGSWHGDWTDWNVVHGDGVVMAWDWERFATDVPLGFDALHYAAQEVLVGRPSGPTPDDAVALIATAARLLAPFGVDAAAAEASAHLYLLEVGTRYAADGQAASGFPAGAIERWMLPVVETTWRSDHSGAPTNEPG